MCKAGLRSKIQRKFRVTTDSKNYYAVSPNLLERNFTSEAADKVWISIGYKTVLQAKDGQEVVDVYKNNRDSVDLLSY